MQELLTDILECIEFVSGYVTSNLSEITEKWDLCSRTHSGLVEKINLSWRVSLETDFLEEFPDIRSQLAKKLEWFANEQLTVLRLLIERLSEINENLKIKLNKINSLVEQISFEQHDKIEHIVREHIMWIENCWTSLHCLYLQINFSMMGLQVLDEESAVSLVGAIKQDEKDKLTLRKSKIYTQSCLSLIKFVKNKNN